MKLDLENAMRRLSSSERQIVTLHLNAGLTHKEIALIMGMTTSAVWRAYKRAITSLRNILNGVG